MTVVVLLFLLSQASAHDLEGSMYCDQDGESVFEFPLGYRPGDEPLGRFP